MALDVKLDINATINRLPEEKRKEFSEELFHVSQDRDWFSDHGIGKTYARPDMDQVKEILFNESYAKYISV
jgi:hypothetical protein